MSPALVGEEGGYPRQGGVPVDRHLVRGVRLDVVDVAERPRLRSVALVGFIPALRLFGGSLGRSSAQVLHRPNEERAQKRTRQQSKAESGNRKKAQAQSTDTKHRH